MSATSIVKKTKQKKSGSDGVIRVLHRRQDVPGQMRPKSPGAQTFFLLNKKTTKSCQVKCVRNLEVCRRAFFWCRQICFVLHQKFVRNLQGHRIEYQRINKCRNCVCDKCCLQFCCCVGAQDRAIPHTRRKIRAHRQGARLRRQDGRA